MRLSVPVLVAITISLAAAPGHAQTYDPRYPVCMQTYSIGGGNINCSFVSMAQCRDLISGRGGAQCLTNPYFAGRGAKPAGQRRAY